MPRYDWNGSPIERISGFQSLADDGEAVALVLWAVWSVDSLHYLGDLDNTFVGHNPAFGEHTAETVDVAHTRWASITCITALDLCAAGLGRVYAPHLRGHQEFDLESLARKPGKKKWYQSWRRIRPVPRELLPAEAVKWLHETRGDARYRTLKYARDRLTHRRVARHFSVGTGPTRLRLSVRDDKIGADELVLMARDLATDRVVLFLDLLEELAVEVP